MSNSHNNLIQGESPPSSKSSPLVHVIIINWNQAKLTNECLQSLFESDYPAITVIVVDNGSTDDSVEFIRRSFPQVIMLEPGENLGYSEGNNFGIRYSIQQNADYILLLNNDTTVAPDMLSRLVETAEADSTIGIVGPTQYYFDEPDTIWGAANYIKWIKGLPVRSRMGHKDNSPDAHYGIDNTIDADYIDTCAALVRREIFEQVGLLDARYFINYDNADLGLRSREAGFRVVYRPAAKMWHKVSASMGLASPATTYYMTRNLLLLLWSRGSGLSRFIGVSRVVGSKLRTIAAWTIKPQYKDQMFQRRRNANLLALRDFCLTLLSGKGLSDKGQTERGGKKNPP
ncbi:glycosyltransferase family 2 protein [Chloroflexi bacterium TSY]|nr:glycosyltransferase family 2 protein [Chloroflexi bacterium TSY]